MAGRDVHLKERINPILWISPGGGKRETALEGTGTGVWHRMGGEISTWKGAEGRFCGYPRERSNARVCTPVQGSDRVGSKRAVFAPTGAGECTGRSGECRGGGEISTWKGAKGRFRGYPRERCNTRVCTPVQGVTG